MVWRGPWHHEVLFVISDILLDQYILNNTGQNKLFQWDLEKKKKKKKNTVCYIKGFVILDLFVSSFHCFDIMSNMANIIEEVIDYFHNT